MLKERQVAKKKRRRRDLLPKTIKKNTNKVRTKKMKRMLLTNKK